MSGSHQTVVHSYASPEAEAAKHIYAALRAASTGVSVAQNEPVGGDAWDELLRDRHADPRWKALLQMLNVADDQAP